MHASTVVIFVLLATCLTADDVGTGAGPGPQLLYRPESGRMFVGDDHEPTPSVYWDRVAQSLIAEVRSGPTVGSFAFAVVHSAIFDAWYTAGSSSNTGGDEYDEYSDTLSPVNELCTNRRIAIAYAGFNALKLVYPKQEKYARDALQIAIKNCSYNEATGLVDEIGYRTAKKAFEIRNSLVLPTNVPMYEWPSQIERWASERVPIDDPNGPVQKYLTEHWGRRYTFGVQNGASVYVPPPEPFLTTKGKVDLDKKTITTASGVYKPDKYGGLNYTISEGLVNPAFIKQAIDVIEASANLTPQQKFTAELWEQGGGSSYPPGCWMTIAEWVSMKHHHGVDDDIKMFYALSNALSDVGVSTWFVKRYYDYARPVRAIRDLGALGLLGVISYYDVSKHKFMSTPATRFVTYQNAKSDPSPPFPEYTSGHSGFSSAAAEVLSRFKGSDVFDASVTLKAFTSRFEPKINPKADVTLHFDTFTKAADDAGKSRIYGGIHFEDGNVQGLRLGRAIGSGAYARAQAEWRERGAAIGSHRSFKPRF